MGKYSDVDIDAMLKRIKDNVDKQGEVGTSDEPVLENADQDVSKSTPEELINLVMADIGKRGGSPQKSTDMDQYDISGFEIEEPEDEDDEISDGGSEGQEQLGDIVEGTITEDGVEDTDDFENTDSEVIEDIGEESDEDIAEEIVEQIQDSVVEKAEEPVAETSEEVIEETSDDIHDDENGDAFVEVVTDESLEAPTDIFEELSLGETDDEKVLIVSDDDNGDQIDEGEDEEHEILNDDMYEADDEADETDEIEEVILEPLPGIDFIRLAEENIPEARNEDVEETSESDFDEIDSSELLKMPKVTSTFTKNSPKSRSFGANGDIAAVDEREDYSGLDYSDMNFAMSLGSKDSLETAFGYVKVSEAKHNFVNTERKRSGSNVILNYGGREYRTFDQNMEIKDAYRREKKHIGQRVIGTAIIFILTVLCEMMYPMGEIADISELMSLQFKYNIISFVLFAIAVAFSARKLFNGVVGFFTTRSNYYTVIGFVSLVNVIYSLLVITSFKDRDMIMLSSVTVFGILIIIIGEYLQLLREIHTFELVSNGKDKISLEKVDITSETTKKASFIDSNDFVIENTNFIGRYFERSARTPDIYHIRHTFVMLTMLLSLFVAVAAVIVTRDFADFVFVIELSSLLCVPVQIVFFGSCAFYITSKKLLKLDSAIIGETLTDEYVGSNTIFLDDVEVFGRHGVHVVNLEPFNNFNIIDVNYYYLSVFSKVSGPLKNAFGEIPENMKLSDEVELVNIFSNGIEATVDEKNRILVGKSEFMRENGVHLAKLSDDKYAEKGDISIMYIAVNGALCAKLYLKYSVTHHFEKFAEDMAENGSSVGVRTLDPNITEKMIARLRPDKENTIKVIRPTLNDLVPIGRRSDSGIITEKNPHMIARILAEGLKVKKVNGTMNTIWVIHSILGILAVIAFMLLGIFNAILPIYIIGYQVIWLVALTIYIKNKLRNGKSR